MRLAALLWLLLTLATTALASDGVVEINQTCAVETGCLAGDSAGFPVTISASGSYRLTGNLVVPDDNTTAIRVLTDDVSLDLAGFEIRGPVVCSGSPLTCAPPSGAGSGIERASSTTSGTSVRNGSIRGMGRFGVLLGRQAVVTNLRVRSNRLDGIFASTASVVSGNAAYENGRDGISAFDGSTVTGNSSYLNGSDGIAVAVGATVSGNTTYRNTVDGIFANVGSTVEGNTSYDNGGDGIQALNGCLVKGNSVRSNDGFGLNLSSLVGYRENAVSSNGAGGVNGGLDAGANIIDGGVTSTP